MKLDGEQVLCHVTIGAKPGAKAEHKDNDLDLISRKSGNGIVNENKNIVLCELKSRDSDTDPSQCSVKDGDPWTASSINEGVLACDNKEEVRHFLAPVPSPQSSLKTDSCERGRFFYMDETVVERELPELVVFYKDVSYDVVKDICVDEGVPSQNRFFFDILDEKNMFTFLPPEKEDGNSEILQEGINCGLPISVMSSSADKQNVNIPDVVKSLEEKGYKDNCCHDCNSEDLMKTPAVKDDAKDNITDNASTICFSLGELLSMPELGKEVCRPGSYNSSMDEVEQKFLQRQSKPAVSVSSSANEESEIGNEQAVSHGPTLVSGSEKPDCSHEEAVLSTTAPGTSSEGSDYGKDTVSTSPVLISASEESKEGSEEAKLARHFCDSVSEESACTITDNLSDNSKVETGNITSDFDFSAPTASMTEDGRQNVEAEHPGTQNMSCPEDTNTNSGSNQLQYNNGESSFSAAVPLSGLISYSGSIAYSGSISLRSDSSTTSARSFAFPILQSEWNSSPVRMAKADKGHFRKNRGWRQCLLCCKF